jgi:hypothetical protein
MRRLLVAFLLTLSVVATAQAPQKTAEPTGRYMLVPAIATMYQDNTKTISPGVESHEVFLIDTQTGRVWKLQPGILANDKDGNPHFQEASFIPISVDEWNAARAARYGGGSDRPSTK